MKVWISLLVAYITNLQCLVGWKLDNLSAYTKIDEICTLIQEDFQYSTNNTAESLLRLKPKVMDCPPERNDACLSIQYNDGFYATCVNAQMAVLYKTIYKYSEQFLEQTCDNTHMITANTCTNNECNKVVYDKNLFTAPNYKEPSFEVLEKIWEQNFDAAALQKLWEKWQESIKGRNGNWDKGNKGGFGGKGGRGSMNPEEEQYEDMEECDEDDEDMDDEDMDDRQLKDSPEDRQRGPRGEMDDQERPDKDDQRGPRGGMNDDERDGRGDQSRQSRRCKRSGSGFVFASLILMCCCCGIGICVGGACLVCYWKYQRHRCRKNKKNKKDRKNQENDEYNEKINIKVESSSDS